MLSVIDISALVVSILVAAGVTAAMLVAFQHENRRRAWIAAALTTAVLIVLGAADVLLRPPREQKVSTVILAAAITVLGALGFVRGTRSVRMWIRAPLTFLVAYVLLMSSLLFGADYVSRVLPF
jgi:intracellular septation protein A